MNFRLTIFFFKALKNNLSLFAMNNRLCADWPELLPFVRTSVCCRTGIAASTRRTQKNGTGSWEYIAHYSDVMALHSPESSIFWISIPLIRLHGCCVSRCFLQRWRATGRWQLGQGPGWANLGEILRVWINKRSRGSYGLSTTRYWDFSNLAVKFVNPNLVSVKKAVIGQEKIV